MGINLKKMKHVFLFNLINIIKLVKFIYFLIFVLSFFNIYSSSKNEDLLDISKRLIEESRYKEALIILAEALKREPKKLYEIQKLIDEISIARDIFNNGYNDLSNNLENRPEAYNDSINKIDKLSKFEKKPIELTIKQLEEAKKIAGIQRDRVIYRNIINKAKIEINKGNYPEALKIYINGFELQKDAFIEKSLPQKYKNKIIEIVSDTKNKIQDFSVKSKEALELKDDLINVINNLTYENVLDDSFKNSFKDFNDLLRPLLKNNQEIKDRLYLIQDSRVELLNLFQEDTRDEYLRFLEGLITGDNDTENKYGIYNNIKNMINIFLNSFLDVFLSKEKDFKENFLKEWNNNKTSNKLKNLNDALIFIEEYIQKSVSLKSLKEIDKDTIINSENITEIFKEEDINIYTLSTLNINKYKYYGEFIEFYNRLESIKDNKSYEIKDLKLQLNNLNDILKELNKVDKLWYNQYNNALEYNYIKDEDKEAIYNSNDEFTNKSFDLRKLLENKFKDIFINHIKETADKFYIDLKDIDKNLDQQEQYIKGIFDNDINITKHLIDEALDNGLENKKNIDNTLNVLKNIFIINDNLIENNDSNIESNEIEEHIKILKDMQKQTLIYKKNNDANINYTKKRIKEAAKIEQKADITDIEINNSIIELQNFIDNINNLSLQDLKKNDIIKYADKYIEFSTKNEENYLDILNIRYEDSLLDKLKFSKENYEILESLKKELILKEMNRFIDKAKTFYKQGEFNSALYYLSEAEKKYKIVIGEKNPLIEYYKKIINTAKFFKDEVNIPEYSPLYRTISYYMNSANYNYFQFKEDKKEKYINVSYNAINSVLKIKPFYSAAKILQLKITKLKDEKEYRDIFNARKLNYFNLEKINNFDEALAGYRVLATLEPNNKSLIDSILALEIKLGLRDDPAIAATRSKIDQEYQNIKEEVENKLDIKSIASAYNRLKKLNIQDSNNIKIIALINSLEVKLGRKSNSSIAPVDRVEFVKAQNYFISGSILESYKIVLKLLKNPTNKVYPPLLSLEKKIKERL